MPQTAHTAAWQHSNVFCSTLQVLQKYYSRALDRFFYRQCDGMVPDAWLQAMASYVEVKMDKLNIPVDPCSNIVNYMFK